MKPLYALKAFVILSLSSFSLGHYTFPDLIANNTLTADWKYVRMTANHYSNGPVTDVTSQAIRCYELDSTSATQAGIATVTAGSTVGFKADNTMGHPGYFSAYLSAASPAANSNNAGLGKTWFKIWEWSPGWTASTGLIFDSENIDRFNFTIPKSTPNGQYLLRGEQIALHVASTTGGAQFYIGWAQINVVGGGKDRLRLWFSSQVCNCWPDVRQLELKPSAGAYSASDPGILLNIYNLPAGFSGYKAPGPTVWKG